MKNKYLVGLVGAAGLAMLSGCAQPAPAAVAVPNNDPVISQPPPTAEGGAATAEVQVQGPVTPPSDISPAAAEVIKLASSGQAEEVILAYVNNSQASFDLSANEIVYLKDLGISSQIVTAMINRDTALRTQVAQNTLPSQPAQPIPQPAEPIPQPAPEPPVVEAPMTPTVQTTPPEDVSYFYNDLAPYGSWVMLDDVGWCWQPRTVAISHGWRPYCDGGHWVYSDCGWYWASDYSWGWAPFHYGRWQLHPRCGWVWSPDRVWGPAWVTWRVAGDNCGWAPLPPHAVFDIHTGWRFNGVRVGVNFDFHLRPDHFTFVAVHDFTHHDLGHRAFPVRQVNSVYRQTTIVNNTTVVNNNIIVNRGIPVDKVSTATHTQIHRASLRDVGPGPDRNVAGRSGGTRGESVVYRHELPANPKPLRVATAQKVDASHPIVHHNELPPIKTNRGVTASTSPGLRTRTDVGTRSRATTDSGAVRQNPARENNQPRETQTVRPGRQVQTSPKEPAVTSPRPSTPPVVEAPRTPTEARRDRNLYDRSQGSRDLQTQRPSRSPEVSRTVEPPKQNSGSDRFNNSSTERFNYGRYGEAPRTTTPLQSPKQSTPQPPRQWSEGPSYRSPSDNRSSDRSGPSGGTTRDYTPKTYTPPPARAERSQPSSAPAPSGGGGRESARSHDNGGGGGGRDNSSRDDSGSRGRKDK